MLSEQVEHVSSHTTAPNDEQTMRMLSAPADNSAPPGQAMESARITEAGFLHEHRQRTERPWAIGGPH